MGLADRAIGLASSVGPVPAGGHASAQPYADVHFSASGYRHEAGNSNARIHRNTDTQSHTSPHFDGNCAAQTHIHTYGEPFAYTQNRTVHTDRHI